MSGEFWRLIESPQNPQFKIWNDLQDGRGIKKHGLYILAGRKLVPEALNSNSETFLSGFEPFHVVVACDPQDVAGLDIPASVDRFRMPRALFDKLDISGTNFPLLIGKVPDLPPADLTRPPQGLELMVALGDPNNLGALMRSAAAFGVKKLILMEEAANPFHPKALRAGANAQMHLKMARGPSLRTLEHAAGPVVALDGTGEPMSRYKWPRDIRIVLGEEGMGVPDALDARRLAIDTTGQVESLNAMVAASLALHAYYTSVN
tara:strand:+ start:557 stop:1342 length:786 start_codon:yes stop_codon:yes gene_type:complete